MTTYRPDVDTSSGAPGTTDQKPRWEGPEETRPRGYLPATDDPTQTPDAAGETLDENPQDNRAQPMQADGSAGEFPAYEQVRRSDDDITPEASGETPSRPLDHTYDGHPEFSQEAAANKPPRGLGNSEPVDDVDAKTRHSDGVAPVDRTRGD